LDSTTRVFSDKEKTDVLVKCAGGFLIDGISLPIDFMLLQYPEAFLEDDASLDAEVFVNKASPFINAIDDLSLQLRYKVTYARVMDANRKFLDAAVRYYELSSALHTNVLITTRVTCVDILNQVYLV
jgi:hypothetical protein